MTLLEEAKQRYPKGTKFIMRDGSDYATKEFKVTEQLIQNGDSISHSGIWYVYHNGQWADITYSPIQKEVKPKFFMKLLAFTTLFLFTVSLQAQNKWYKITRNDVKIMTLQAISGTADGFNQAIIHHHYGQGNKFWDQDVSWMNKYKNYPTDTRAKYFGSKTFLVWTTDGFHLTRWIDRASSIICVGISLEEMKKYKSSDIWKVILKKIILSYVVNRAFFNLTYNNL